MEHAVERRDARLATSCLVMSWQVVSGLASLEGMKLIPGTDAHSKESDRWNTDSRKDNRSQSG